MLIIVLVDYRQYNHLLNQPSLFQGYPQPSLPQDIPRGNTYESPLGSPSVPGIWDTRSPASSDSGWSNASSPLVGQFGEGRLPLAIHFEHILTQYFRISR